MPVIPASAWAHTPWPVTVCVFVFLVGGVFYFPRILSALTGWEGNTVKASGELGRQALLLADGVQEDLVGERLARLAARRDADRGWWLARHWHGVAWTHLDELRRALASLRRARLVALAAIERWNAAYPSEAFPPPEWAIEEDGRLRPADFERPGDLQELEGPQAPTPNSPGVQP